MKIAIASGKGGTGKTTIAVSLAQALVQESSHRIILSDCDVETPNAHLFLKPNFTDKKVVNQWIPEIQEDLCNGCGICGEVCQFNAIIVLGDKPLVFPELCHGCGSCTLMCPEQAIHEIPNQIGILDRGIGREGITLRQGLLNVGEPLAVPVIAELKKWDSQLEFDLEIIDCPPGASCPVVESVSGADFILLVTEPTPFGLHDLKAAYEVTRAMSIPAAVVVNRAGFSEDKLSTFCHQNDLPMLLKIPLDRKIGEEIAQGNTLLDFDPEYGKKMVMMFEQIYTIFKEGQLN